jgi:predicted porin
MATLLINRDGAFEVPADGWYQLSPLGEFPHAQVGVVQVIDAQAVSSIVNRFNAMIANDGGSAWPLVDFDHFSLDTAKPSEAAGWITNMQARADGLWAQIKWSDVGDAAVRGGRYRFLSPVFNRRDCEDLGGGKKAEFVLEYQLMDNGATSAGGNATPFNSRAQYVGISDKNLGGLRLGRQASASFVALGAGLVGAYNNMPGSVYSAGNDKATNSASVRPVTVFVNNAVTYISPKFAGLELQVQTGQISTSADDAAAAVSSAYSGGSLTYTGVKNLTVAYGYFSSYETSTSAKLMQQNLAGNYNFGVAQVFANLTQAKNTTLGSVVRDQKATEIGVRVPVTPVVGVWASAFMGNNNGVNGASMTNITGRTDSSGFQLGTTYAMSKRTTAYAIYGQQDVKGKDLASGQKIATQGYAVGLRHTF